MGGWVGWWVGDGGRAGGWVVGQVVLRFSPIWARAFLIKAPRPPPRARPNGGERAVPAAPHSPFDGLGLGQSPDAYFGGAAQSTAYFSRGLLISQ